MIDEIATFMADDDNDKLLSVKERERWYKQITIGAAGFFLAVSLAAINAISATRGSVIVVQPPQQVTLYRDGEGNKAVLTLAVRLAMINSADASNGDVLMDAHLSPIPDGPVFGYGGTVKPVFTDNPDVDKCDVGARCVALKGLLAIEQTDEIIDIPGGTVRGPYLYYPIAGWNCIEAKAKPPAMCAQFADFDTTVNTLSAKPLSVRIDIDLFQDGSRQIYCKAPAINAAYLKEKGWTTMSCESAKVTGAPWF
jgi:hypothetical protein